MNKERRGPREPIVLPDAAMARERERAAGEVVATLNRQGIAADLVRIEALEDLVRRRAEQILVAARRCRFPDVRADMEETARAALAELDRIQVAGPPFPVPSRF